MVNKYIYLTFVKEIITLKQNKMEKATVIIGDKLSRVENNSFELFQFLKDNNLTFVDYDLYYGKNRFLVKTKDVVKFKKIIASEFRQKESNLKEHTYIIF